MSSRRLPSILQLRRQELARLRQVRETCERWRRVDRVVADCDGVETEIRGSDVAELIRRDLARVREVDGRLTIRSRVFGHGWRIAPRRFGASS